MAEVANEMKCPNCGASLTLKVFQEGGACTFCGAEVEPDPTFELAQMRERAGQVRVQEAEAEARKAEAQADMVRRVSEMTARGYRQAANAERGSRRASLFVGVAIAFLLLMVLVRVLRERAYYDKMMQQTVATEPAANDAPAAKTMSSDARRHPRHR